MKTEIIYEDRYLLVIHKPAGLATQSAKPGQMDVVSELKNYLAHTSESQGQPYLGVIHRLDQPVEGLLVFAKEKKAAAALTKQLSGQKGSDLLNKQYYAVFCGKPSQREGELVDYMYKGSDGRAVIGEGADAKKAVLHYQVVQSTVLPGGENLSLADIQIETGRFHQIRAQMAHAGMALLGDVKYGDEASKGCSHKLGISTVALCAYRLAFSHPVTGKKLCFERKPVTRAFSFFNL